MTARERLRELALSATPGPWHQSELGYSVRCASGPVTNGSDRREDAAFIAACSPSVVLGLLGELEEAERAVRDTYLAINHKAVKTAEIRPIARLAAMLREQMDDMRYTDIVEVLQDFYAVAEAVGAVHEQSMGKPHPGTREEVVSAIESLKARIAELEARLNARPEISREDAKHFAEFLDRWHPTMEDCHGNDRVHAALRAHGDKAPATVRLVPRRST